MYSLDIIPKLGKFIVSVYVSSTYHDFLEKKASRLCTYKRLDIASVKAFKRHIKKLNKAEA